MKYGGILALAAVAAIGCVRAAGDTPNDGAAEAGAGGDAVVVLTQDSFNAFVERHPLVLVKFYAPWCGHCKKLAPEYERAAKMLAEEGSAIKLGKVDATVESELGDRFHIRGYPTLKLFRNGEPEEYSGGRQAENITEWLRLMTGPVMKEFKTREEYESAVKENKGTLFVGVFRSQESEGYRAFEQVAGANRKLGQYGYLLDSGNEEEVRVHRSEEGEVVCEGTSKEKLAEFVKNESLPYFGPINGDNFQLYHDKDTEMVWFCGNAEDYEDQKKTMRSVAREFRGQYGFVWLDTAGYQMHAEKALGLTSFPGLVVQSKSGRYVYPTDQFEASALKKWFDEIAAGKVEKSLKSEEAPVHNEEPVKVVVGTTMEEMVVRKDKDAFLEIYASWCGHCKKFAPIYEEFAKSVADDPHIVVAKMDGSLNESPLEAFSWTGFPTIFFVRAGQATPTQYDGERTLDGLTTFWRKHRSEFAAAPKAEL